MSLIHKFPEGFVWGVATSAYQIEGATLADGRSDSIWDAFCRKPGAIDDGSNGDVACEHYTRYPEDVALMANLGVHSYRFSISWPRVIPGGTGTVNTAGLDFYERLVDELLGKGIAPSVTLYHWDLPQILEERGGWPNRDTALAFVEYAEAVVARLGDRVKDWITHNEPWCASMLGYHEGIHAPGLKSRKAAVEAAHHMLLSHGLAVPVLREGSPGANVGITLNLVDPHSASQSPADLAATKRFDGTFNRWFLEPLYRGVYPTDIMEFYQEEGAIDPSGFRVVRDGDMDIIQAPTDFLGINYYSRGILRSDSVPEKENWPREIAEPEAHQKTDIGWEVYPLGLYNLLVRLHEEYAPPSMYITENGAAYHTAPTQGRVRDVERQAYLYEHMLACREAMEAGVPLAGYFVWSLMDNFEWSFGYDQRFGIVWVDYETQERILKDSAHWYRGVISRNELVNPAKEEG